MKHSTLFHLLAAPASMARGAWSFAIATATATPNTTQELCSQDSVTVVVNGSSGWPFQTYVTTDSRPPFLQINATGESLEPGVIVYGPRTGFSVNATVSDPGPYLITDTGDVVWIGPVDQGVSNFRAQHLFGEPVLTWWSGTGNAAIDGLAGHGYGNVTILNSSYDEIMVVCPKFNLTLPTGFSSECDADVHESYITPNNTMVLTAYNITTADLRSVGGPENGFVWDALAYEIDLVSGDVLFQWSALAHVPINSTNFPIEDYGLNASNPFDWFHMNSIQPFEGHYLINSRQTWASYFVDPAGDIVWEINGKDGGDFGSLPVGGQFSWQHYARIFRTSETDVSIRWFANDDADPYTTVPSVGLMLNLTLPPDPANPPRLLTNLSDPVNPVAAFAEGSFDPLSNGNFFADYGVGGIMKEFGPRNDSFDVRWSARFGVDIITSSYRAQKTEWHATPSAPPALNITRMAAGGDANSTLSGCVGASSSLRGYVSWNGATDIQYYELYAGNTTESMSLFGVFQKQGFETEFYIPDEGQQLMQVGAVQDTVEGVVKSAIVSVR